MTISKSKMLPLALAIAALATLAFASLANATHVRPRGATPILVSLVPAHQACAAPGNRVHGGGLAFASCNPPVAVSPNLTPGTPDANGAVANLSGSLRIDVCPVPGCAAPNVKLSSTINDVRCKAGVATCGSANTADGADYTGEVQANATIRITDHNNDTTPTATCTTTACKTATVVDIPFPVKIQCVATSSDATKGADCNISTTANAVVPGAVVSGAKGVVEVGQLRVEDGGPDGTVATNDNSTYLVQGIFIP
jgi:hypothetical protein